LAGIMKKFYSGLFFVAYLISLILIVGLAAEGFARFMRPQLIHPTRDEQFRIYDPEIGWVNKPSVEDRFKSEDFDVSVRVNAEGLRDDVVHSPQKAPGIFRIAVLGDSFTWGYGVEASQTFSKRLEKDLPQTEVLNFGCSGYGQDQELLLLKRKVVQYHPDLIIVNLHAASDFENNPSFFQYGFYKSFSRFENEKIILENVPVPVDSLGAKLNTWLINRSVAWRLLGNRKWKGINLVALLVAAIDKKPELIQKALHNLPPVALTCSLCRTIQLTASKRGIKVLFILSTNLRLPQGQLGNRLFPEDERYRQLRDCLQLNGIEFIDMMPFFKNYIEREKGMLTFRHDAHWNVKGHELVANAAREYLLSHINVQHSLSA
jgi:hypothetical protein